MASAGAPLAAGFRLIRPSVVDLMGAENHPIDVAGWLHPWEEMTNKGRYDKTGDIPSGGAPQNSIRLITGD